MSAAAVAEMIEFDEEHESMVMVKGTITSALRGEFATIPNPAMSSRD